MKSGFASGAIAGFFAGTLTIFGAIPYQLALGLQPATVLKDLPFTGTVHLGYNIIWAAVFGVIYTKFYDVIPGKGAKKGLVYGLIIYLMIALLPASYYLANGNFTQGNGYLLIGILYTVTYGFLQGILYDGSKHPGKIENNLKDVIIAGSIAGLVGGIVASVLTFIGFIIGIPYWAYYPHYHPITSITSVVAIEFILMLVWGIVFSSIFLLLFVKIPGKGIMKGLYFGLLLCLLCVIRPFSWGIPYAFNPQSMAMSVIGYSLAFISYGLVLGLLYRKPTETTTVKEKISEAEKVQRCQHCGTSIPTERARCNVFPPVTSSNCNLKILLSSSDYYI